MMALAVCLFAAPANAHVTVWPKESAAGAREKYDVRLPNEKAVDTVGLELRLPQGLKLNSVEQKADWQATLVRDQSGVVVGIRWNGKLPPMQFAEFGLLATNPTSSTELVFEATQFFADGSEVQWIGPVGSKAPAPRVHLTDATAK
jgi:uncharacterized protein YcnI